MRCTTADLMGEERSPQIWQYIGGPNTLAGTETNNLATVSLFMTNAPGQLYPSTAASAEAKFIHFILNERTRELCGEFYRWEDLVRTETFYDRTKLFNPDISPSSATFHKLRPIRYLQMIAQTVGGKTMSQSDMAAYQNTGY